MITEIDLSNYNYIFEESKMNGLVKKNFIYGKNGTGKSSLKKAIKEQYGDKYDIHCFEGWKNIIEMNDRLDAISLGTNNKNLQTDINDVEEEIRKIEYEIKESNDPKEHNLYKRLIFAKGQLKKATDNIENFYTLSAKYIEGKIPSGNKYMKPHFKKDIQNANLLEEMEREKLIETINTMKIVEQPKLSFINDDLNKYLQSANELLKFELKPSKMIKELNDDINKESFAREGMKVHTRNNKESCAFCGNDISTERWNMLDNYFSKEMDVFEERLKKGIEVIDDAISRTNDILLLNERSFYPFFKEQVNDINKHILLKKEGYIKFLVYIKDILNKKKGNVTTKMTIDDLEVPNNFGDVVNIYKQVYKDNEDYKKSIDEKKREARRKLILHEVNIELDKFNYYKEKEKLLKMEIEVKLITDEFEALEQNLATKKELRADLISKSSSEASAADEINKYLKLLGNSSFSLHYIENQEGQKGQYSLKNKRGLERSVQTLSDGEKNIVAFLWFMHNLEEVKEHNEVREKVVIFDDPMNSNDDHCQYLIIGIIQKMYQSANHPQIILLTHNNHFYLQVTPTRKKYVTEEKPNPNQKYYHLRKINDSTKIKLINNGKEELKPVYDELWEELKFAYENDKTIFMWNNMRRILETYNRFVFKKSSPSEIEHQLEELSDKVLALALIKSLHVNSHIGYQTDIDISGITKENLLSMFKELFEKIGSKDHFNYYWQ